MKQLLWILLLTIPMALTAPCIPKEQERSENQSYLHQKKLNDFRNSSFTPYLMYEALVYVGIQNPRIVFRQAILETGHFTSSSFRDYNNPFGMKKPKYRETLCTGTGLGHGSFDHWFEAVQDYKMWQDFWLDTILTEEQYYYFLDTLGPVGYAESKNYTRTLRRISLDNLVDIPLS